MQSLLESCDRGGFNPFHLVHNTGNNCEASACLSCQPEEDIPRREGAAALVVKAGDDS